MKICESRKSTNTIMSNQGFGGMIIKKDGVIFYVKPSDITSEGKVMKRAINKLNRLIEEHNKEKEII